jgi:hypothetical protein
MTVAKAARPLSGGYWFFSCNASLAASIDLSYRCESFLLVARMSDSEKSVFISYRRDYGASWARAILQDPKAHGYDVFVDVESIVAGRSSA